MKDGDEQDEDPLLLPRPLPKTKRERLPPRQIQRHKHVQNSSPETVEKAAVLAAFMNLAYEFPDLPAVLEAPYLCGEPYQFVHAEQDPATETLFVVYKNRQNHHVVSFRGTELGSYRNHLTNLMMWRVRCRLGSRCGRVHYGFQRAYMRLRPALYRVLRSASRISFTGHSLGGALAILATYDFKTHGRPVVNCYVFGCPKVGNAWFEMVFSHLKVDEMRIIQTERNTIDFIPRLPFGLVYSDPYKEHWWFEYAHPELPVANVPSPSSPPTTHAGNHPELGPDLDLDLDVVDTMDAMDMEAVAPLAATATTSGSDRRSSSSQSRFPPSSRSSPSSPSSPSQSPLPDHPHHHRKFVSMESLVSAQDPFERWQTHHTHLMRGSLTRRLHSRRAYFIGIMKHLQPDQCARLELMAPPAPSRRRPPPPVAE